MPTDLQLDRDTLEWVAVGAAVAAGLALLLVLLALGRVRALSKRLRRLQSAGPARPGTATGGPVDSADPTALRHFGMVRYDAFGDMGGRLSFSAAIYDDHGDGLVISSINGRSETRTYAKELVELGSEHALSPEEEAAIKAAGGRPGR